MYGYTYVHVYVWVTFLFIWITTLLIGYTLKQNKKLKKKKDTWGKKDAWGNILKFCMFLFCFHSWMVRHRILSEFWNLSIAFKVQLLFTGSVKSIWFLIFFMWPITYYPISLSCPTPEVCRNFSVAPGFRISWQCPLGCVYFHLLCWTLLIWKLRSLHLGNIF